MLFRWYTTPCRKSIFSHLTHRTFLAENSAELTDVGRNNCKALKIEPDDELHSRRKNHACCGTDIEERRTSSRRDYTSEVDYNLPPSKRVKVEPEEELVSPTESTLYDGSYVNGPKIRVLGREHLNETYNRKRLSRSPALGYSVYVENPRNGILASSFQLVSNELLSKSNLSEYWLPILSTVEDWRCIKEEFLSTVDRVCRRIHFHGSTAKKVFKVCSSLMNGAVVSIMKSGKNETETARHINGFFSIYRLLNQYAQDDEYLIQSSNRALTNFMRSPTERVKEAVPNLGEFLMHLTVSTQWTWTQISKVFMDESDTRCVFWYCCGNHRSPAAHPELINVYHYMGDREAKVFHATTVSRNLIMFQVKFANMTKSPEMAEFCTNFERVRDFLTAKLKNLYDRVVAVKNWDQFYDFLDMPRVTLANRNSELVQAVTRSAAQGYHKPSLSDMRAGIYKIRRMR